MASKIVSILVTVVLVLNILVVTGKSPKAGIVTENESKGMKLARGDPKCPEVGEKCAPTNECCVGLYCKYHGGVYGRCSSTYN